MKIENRKIIIVTGAASGIGKAVASSYLADKENFVYLIDSTYISCRDGENYSEILLDVRNSDDVIGLYKKVKVECGKLNILVNCAGVEGVLAPIIRQKEEDYDFVMSTNVKGTWLMCKEAIKLMLYTENCKSIVNISSVMGLVAAKYSSIYCASKFAINGITKALAVEYASKGIRVNGVCPGGVNTSMLSRIHKDDYTEVIKLHPIGKVAEAEEIANIVCWLTSDSSSFVTGSIIAADGGYTSI
jgi:NAD(P)-dependent dehydrogenase (short-subunit alcohol dehydrogenase family)